jgi:dTDP-4-dehydrorhamnose 3,5-epimerase
MIFTETKLKGAFIIEIKKLEDERGFFGRSWCAREFSEYGLKTELKQANTSLSLKKGTLRGMHYQNDPYQETKLLRCTRGSIYDVIIDLRKDSPTYKQWIGVELTQDNYKMLYVPEDFAHGFITLQDNTEVNYLVTQFYVHGAEAGIRWNDPGFNIQWPLEPLVISEKDKSHPNFKSNAVKI